MVFSSLEFLFIFLPLTLLFYFMLNKKYRNVFLLIASLFFYAWGETFLVLVMIASIMITYLGGILINYFKKKENNLLAKFSLILTISLNLSFLIYFKYSNFFVENVQSFGFMKSFYLETIILPIGISFYTFQALSYVIDVYRNDALVQRNPINLGLYISLFPQLIAGPIVRYHDIAKQIVNRNERTALFASGVLKFVRGFVKKILIANPMGLIADSAFSVYPDSISTLAAWAGVIAYTLQIYFDFSGYSDMAIGLGRMFGFTFLENFKHPYISKSIQEFWRRWHISLSSWFRDYLYIPLGGNRIGVKRTYFNLIFVFLITGLWHGANWNFMLWGLYHGFFLILERLGLLKRISNPMIRHVYVILIVIVGWVFFRAESFTHSINYLKSMFLFTGGGLQTPIYYFDNYYLLILLLGILFSTPIRQKLFKNSSKYLIINHSNLKRKAFIYVNLLIYFGLMTWCIAELSVGSYNPFIYFRF